MRLTTRRGGFLGLRWGVGRRKVEEAEFCRDCKRLKHLPSKVWVVAVKYDDGLATAEFFCTKEKADAWIEAEHARRRAKWNQSWAGNDQNDYDDFRTEFYAAELQEAK